MIEIEGVGFSYEQQRRALERIDLTIPQGECILLCGESGCGKTTVTKLVNGLIPHFTAGGSLTGSVRIDGSYVADMKMYELAKTVGSVFQNPKSQFFNLDSDSELSFGLENEGVPPEEIKKRVRETVEQLNIQRLEHRNIFSMSGGEKQLLAFASVYAMRPRIFVLDEPSANLDTESEELLKRQLRRAQENGHTIIVAEHRLSFLADVADRIVYLKEGGIERIWGREEFLSIGEQRRIALGLRSLRPAVLRLKETCTVAGDAQLVVEGLSYAYKKREVLKRVDFSASYGDIIGIVGKNGIGKSTFCQCLCGLLKRRSGTVRFEGKALSRKECQKLCALVMQDVNHQLFSDSVWDECEMAAADGGKTNIAAGAAGKSTTAERIAAVLEQFDLLEYLDSHPMALLGGQKQRLAVAAAVLSEKRVLIFDEPTSGLDYRHMMEVSSLLKELGNSGHIILVVSHDTEFLNETCMGIFRLE